MNIFWLLLVCQIINVFFYSTLIAYSYRTKTCANDELSKADQRSRLSIFWISSILLVANVILFIVSIFAYNKNPNGFNHTGLFQPISMRNTNIILTICSIIYLTFILHYLKQSKQYCLLDNDTTDLNTSLMNSIYAGVMINCGFVGYLLGKINL